MLIFREQPHKQRGEGGKFFVIHEINLKSYQAVCDSPNNLLDLGTSGSYGIEQLHVTADSAWDGLVLTAVFTNGASTEVPVVSGVADVPPEATAYPTHAGRRFGRIVFKGCDAEGAVRLISNALLYTIADSGEIDGENTIAPTPDQYAQFVAEVTAEADRAEAAANRAESAGSNVTPEQIAEAVNNYLTENPVQATPIDATLTQSGQAADAAAVGDRLSALSGEKVSLPKDTDGNVIHGTVGWYAVSDGAGGITWVESAPSTGGGGGTTTHGIVWDLVNVTSSNNAVSVDDGSSLVAVLTPADGYTLGDVIVTMGGEVITGAWNADTATVTIQSVTGDVVISCAGVEIPSIVDTTAKIAAYDKGYYWGSQIEAAEYTGACVTEIYPYAHDIDKLKAHASYDAGNDCMTATTMFPKMAYYIPNAKFIEAGNSVQSTRTKFAYSRDGAFYNVTSVTMNQEKTTNVGGTTNNAMYGNGVAFTLFTADLDDSYAYWSVTGSQIAPVGVRHGDIIFAGKNTPYYGMANIDGTMAGGGSGTENASALSVDDDYAMDYVISTLSLLTNESASVATDTGLDAAYASVIEEAKNAWMVEANGSVDKIPLIIHTDQHGNFSKPLWDTINKLVDWYEISKVVNLGDTVSAWSDADAEHPLTKDAGLEAYLESMKSVPYSKRIEIFGNHDTWKIVDGNTVALTPQNYLRKYFKNICARGKDNYGNMVVYDDRYNVKYLIISGMAYDSEIGGYAHYIIPSASWDWIIDQLEMADGYDVVVMSHVALGSGGATIIDPTGGSAVSSCGNVDWVSRADFWAARKNKTSGSFTDQYGVVHAYDFTNCDSNLLCGLHGHEHADGYYYAGNSLLDAFFDAYYISPRAIHFVLIDRANSQLNVWKVDDTPQVQNYQIPLDKPAE